MSVLFCGGALSVGQTPTAANEIPIELPVYTVTELPFMPEPERWSYASFDGYEILSSAGVRRTQDVLQELRRFQQAVSWIWPGLERPGDQTLIVLCSDSRFRAFFRPEDRDFAYARSSLMARAEGYAVVVADMQAFGENLGDSLDIDNPSAPITANLPAEWRTMPAGVTNEGMMTAHSYNELNRLFLKSHLRRLEQPAAYWLEEGLIQLVTAMRITDHSVSLGKVGSANDSEYTADYFNVYLGGSQLLPLSEMFAHQEGDKDEEGRYGARWAKQCYAFVHWGIYGELGKNQKNFLTFLLRLNKEPLTEAMFKECFGKSYEEMLLVLRSHIDWTRSKVAGLQAAKGEKLPLPPVVEVREATEAEIGRIRGDVLLALGQPVPARQAMIAAYMRGERDPELLAALGVWESRHGDSGKARRFLELAIKNGTRRPHAYLEMVAWQRKDISTARLTVSQAAPLFALAYKALGHPPRLAASYRTIAELWKDCEVAAPNPHLEVMLEGVRMFPRDVELLFQVAVQCRRSGRVDEARALAVRGLSLAADEATRTRFQTLADSLPPAPS